MDDVRAAELIAELRPLLSGALIATDFDGTLAPLVPDPEHSRPARGAIDALAALAARGAQVAVITGRDAATVLRLGGFDAVPGVVVAGVYGIEMWTGGEISSPETPDAIERLRDRLPRALAAGDADPAMWIEDKRLSLVVHARRTRDPAAALDRVRPAVAAVADELGFELHPGTGVLEVRLPGFDKGAAIARLVELHKPTAVVYLGDDLGDLPAFAELRALRERGIPAWSIAVTSSGVPEVGPAADLELPDAAAAVDLLVALAE